MPDETVMEHEADIETKEDSFDEMADKFLDEQESETPADSSPETKTEEETSETEDSSAETEKAEKSEGKEEDIPKGFHEHPAWQRILKERDKSREELEALKQKSSEIDSRLEQFNKVTSSPAFIKAQMQAEGYTQEAINNKLAEMGHPVEKPQEDGLQSVLNRLNVDVSQLTDTQKEYINTQVADMVKVADLRIQDAIESFKNKELGTLEQKIGQFEQANTADKLVDQMKETVNKEKILDFDKDIEPELQKFLDSNPKASQQDVVNYFRDLNHRLSIERLRAKEKQVGRDKSKQDLKQNQEGAGLPDMSKIEKTGNFDTDADAFFDALGVD